MKSKSVQMDNAEFVQVENGRIVVKTHNFLAWLAITALTPFLVLFLWEQRIEILKRFIKANITQLECIFTFILIILMFKLIGSLRKNIIIVNAPNRIIRISRGISTQRIPFSMVSHIKIIESTPYHHPAKGIHILVVLRNEEIILFGRVSGSNNMDAPSRAENIANLLANAMGVEVLEETPLERLVSSDSKGNQPFGSLLPPVKLWTPTTVGLTSFFLGFPGGVVLSSINWTRMGLMFKAILHLIGLSIVELLLTLLIILVPELQVELAIGLVFFVNIGISFYLQYQTNGGLPLESSWSVL